MRYGKLKEAVFIERPNRFAAWIETGSGREKCHVKNTGRLGELLVPGAKLLVEPSDDPGRKTRFSLICVEKDGQWVNIDSQAPNRLAREWIDGGGLFQNPALVKQEKPYGTSRFDLYVEEGKRKWFIEVKGVTLVIGGAALFPDAPTERGLKHMRELTACVREGYHAMALFVVQRKGARYFTPFEERQPAFLHALREARDAGVKVLAVDCATDREGIRIDDFVPVRL